MAPITSLLSWLPFIALFACATPAGARSEILHARKAASLGRPQPAYGSCVSHPDQKKCQPVAVNYMFEVVVPVLVDSLEHVPWVNYGGLHFRLPGRALSGLLVSFFGNFDANQTTATQLQMVDLNTSTSSTSLSGGPSMANGTAMANSTTLVALTFSSGNASR